MQRNLIIVILTSLFLFSCGYTPMYSKNIKKKFDFQTLNFAGDKDINKILKLNLDRYDDKSSEKKFKISTTTKYVKNIVTKNSEGDATNFDLNASIIFTITSGDIEKTFIFSKNSLMKKQTNKYEEISFERSIKKNFATSFTNNLIFELYNFE
tara:strand:- start:182 stop:640 length:459 start_codon:yes stop_codon:yes gene_type:complete